MDLYEAMSTLRAVRRLKPDPIAADVVQRILQAATWAPTGGNAQPWRVVVVRERAAKQKLGTLYDARWKAYSAGHRKLLAKAPGVKVVDDPVNRRYPMPIDAAGQDDTLVGRIREDISIENGLCLWISADNIRKGAATNAVQIAEILVRDGLL